MRDEISEVNSDLIISELHINNNKKITVLTAEINDFCDKAESANLDIVVLNIKSLENSIPWPGKVHIRAIISWEKAVRRFEKLKCFLICVSRGLISGPSLELLLTTDYRIVTSSSMLQLSLNRNLVWPGMALYRLSSHIGRSQTRKIIMSRAGLSAIEMLNLGLVDEITENIDYKLNEVITLKKNISGIDFAIYRQLIADDTTTDYEEALGTHLAACDRLLRKTEGK